MCRIKVKLLSSASWQHIQATRETDKQTNMCATNITQTKTEHHHGVSYK